MNLTIVLQPLHAVHNGFQGLFNEIIFLIPITDGNWIVELEAGCIFCNKNIRKHESISTYLKIDRS